MNARIAVEATPALFRGKLTIVRSATWSQNRGCDFAVALSYLFT
jgi:hypothetical protein